MIMKCTCDHEFQDKQYGAGNRVHTKLAKVNPCQYRCTVCEKVKSGSDSAEKKVK